MSKTFFYAATMLILSHLLGCQATQNSAKPQSKIPHIRGENINLNGFHETRAKTFGQHYILEAQTSKKLLSLTFDDGPSQYTLAIAKVLAKYKIPATFFMLGNEMQQHPEIVKAIHHQGHQIANHSWDHPDVSTFNNAKTFWQQQVASQATTLKQIVGISSNIFRPPYGRITDTQVEHLIKNGMVTVMFSIDTKDWDENDNAVDTLVDRATKYAHPGAIILMHDGGGNRQNTVNALAPIIEFYLAQGYQFVRLDTLLAND
ncbi:polysaccharide deacetylase family protein [Thalassotalea marina]|uniref:NodB homology domain-containing protein n=1 Tax=Thalassotalea marina TaxID=1673741 RepID=A0A919BCE0_9GAMM|nr:polysaccharide deacetylase family protein [Thalassotalea marina]GHF79273.1 hypothetical protein GCM10017161_03050 [Thalassotalea marina]